jgi:hypothetical protein
MVSNTTGILTVPKGGTGVATFTAGFLRTSGGAAAFTTVATISLVSEVTGVLGATHGGLGHDDFTEGYIRSTGADDFLSVLPIPSADLASTLTNKILNGTVLLPDATSDALLFVSDGGGLSGVRYTFDPLYFNLDQSGTNPIIINVGLNETLAGPPGQGFTWEGAWSGATTYDAYDVVSSGGSIYICTATHTNQVPPNVLYWDLGASKGDTGSAGADGADGTDGQGFNWLGPWSGATAYVAYDVVSSGGSIYVCTAPNTNQVPPNVAYWDLGASKGDTGTTGAAGADGADGADGQGFNWLGAWSGATAYVAYDVVSSGGSIYVCTAPNTNQVPPNVLYWDLGASKGDTGTTGAAGADGADGQGFTWLGAWSGATAYVAYDVVSSGGSIYVCTAPNTNQVPPNALYWDLGASKGDTGSAGADGADGADGTDGQGFTWLGAWSGATAYVAYDVVSSGGSIYICTAPNTNQVPPNALYWDLGASKGDTGSTGSAGADGADGADGAAGAGYGGTSTTSETIGNSGSKSLTLAAGTYAYAAGNRVRFYNSAGNFMEGVVTTFSSLVLTMTADYAKGSGTYTSWTVGLTGDLATSLSATYSTAGSYTFNIPSGTKFVRAVFCGAGGGGGAGNNGGSSAFGGGGGGGGGFCRIELIPVDSDTSIGIVVGTGGAGAQTAQGDGAAGTSTTLTLGTRVLTAYAGGGGAGVTVDAQSGGGGGSGGSGSDAGSATTNTAGAAGGGTATGFMGLAVTGVAGGAGSSSSGAGAAGTDAAVRNALFFAGGGGGAGGCVSNTAGRGGNSPAYSGGAAGTSDASKGAGGGGGGTGFADGGAGGGTAGSAGSGSKGSGGGGGRGGTGSTWGIGGDGGAGYVFLQVL